VIDSIDDEALRAERMKFDPYLCTKGDNASAIQVKALGFFGAS
jgi:hypothetical protein